MLTVSSCTLLSALKHEQDDQRDHQRINRNRFSEHDTENHVRLNLTSGIRVATDTLHSALHQQTDTNAGTKSANHRETGANRLQTFFQIALPLAKPALATLAVIEFLASWNDFLWALLVLKDRTVQTLQPGLRTLQGAYTSEYGLMMAGAVIVALPVLILYIFLQRYIVQSVATTGLKG